MIPDTQVKPGVPTDHLSWIGQYIVDKFAEKDVVLIHIGDHYDMPSLSSYDKGKKAMEGRRVEADIIAGADGWERLNAPLHAYNDAKQKKSAERKRKFVPWNPRKIVTKGNHEYRVDRACEENAQIDGLLSPDLLWWGDWEVHDFLEIVRVDGIAYSHYFANPMSGRPYGGQNIETRLKTIGTSFTMGHQQGLWWARRNVLGKAQNGLVAGACYLHKEDYLGPQGNDHWRGIVVCHQVEEGDYDVMSVSLDFLCRRYEGVRLEEFLAGS